MIFDLPDGLEHARTTDVFDAGTVPAGLLRAHQIASGVWGRLVVHAGSVRFVFEDDLDGETTVSDGASIVIPPNTPHHVELGEGARFAIEFYRPPPP